MSVSSKGLNGSASHLWFGVRADSNSNGGAKAQQMIAVM
jgi:hypothetical protein